MDELIVAQIIKDELAAQSVTTPYDVVAWLLVTVCGVVVALAVTAMIRLQSSIHQSLGEIKKLCMDLNAAHEDPNSPFATVAMFPLIKRILDVLEDIVEFQRWMGQVLEQIMSTEGVSKERQLLLKQPKEPRG